MTIKRFDRPTLRILGDEIEAALVPVAKKHGISIRRGRGTFTEESYTVRIECSLLNEKGEAVTKEAQDFQRYAGLFGLEPGHFGRVFQYQGERFTICGLKVRSRKFPILARRSDGKVFKLNAEVVKRNLLA